MSSERESRPPSRRHRPPVKYHQSDDDDDDDDDDTDDDYDPHDDDDDDELPDLESKQRQQLTAQARYRARHPDRVAATQQRFLAKRESKALKRRAKCKRYRAKHPETRKKYRETHRDFLAETHSVYRERHRARVAANKKRYRERHPERVAESQKRYRERHRARVAEAQRRYRERHPARVAEAQKRYNEKRRERYQKHVANNEKKRTAEKLNALGPLTLTIPLTDCLKAVSVTRYVQAFCDSLESEDTNVPPADSHTLMDLDSGIIQVVDSPEWENLSFLQELFKDMSPDDWQQAMNDVEDFDVETLLPPEDLVHDISSDEGIDLLFDIVT